MDPILNLHRTLKAACCLLDSAAGQIRDSALSPTKEHIHKIAVALSEVFEVQHAIYKVRPELEEKHVEPQPEVREANRRLGETLISAYDLADQGQLSQAVTLLRHYSEAEPSLFHKELAANEIERLTNRYGV